MYTVSGNMSNLRTCLFHLTNLNSQTAMGIAPQWFDKRRGLALGMATSGSGIGGLVVPFIMSPLLEQLGAAWCYRVLGFISLAVGLFASIFIQERYPSHGRKKLSELMYFGILKNPNFVIWNIACDLCLLGYLVPFYLLPSKNSFSLRIEHHSVNIFANSMSPVPSLCRRLWPQSFSRRQPSVDPICIQLFGTYFVRVGWRLLNLFVDQGVGVILMLELSHD